jgi:hypothetical protein
LLYRNDPEISGLENLRRRRAPEVPLLFDRTAQQRIEGLQNEILFAWWEVLDTLHAAKHTAAGLAAQGLRAVGPEQFIGGDFEGSGEADGHLSGEPELAALIVRDQGLNDADALGEFGLGVAAFFPEPSAPESGGRAMPAAWGVG